MSKDEIEVTWKVSDGRIGGGIHKTRIDVQEVVDNCDSEEDARSFICELIQEDFETKVIPSWEESEEQEVIDAWREKKDSEDDE